MNTQILQLTSPVEILSVSSDINTRFVKGFASVQRPDRQGHLVPPEGFNIPKFLASSGTLLRNHEFWVDDRGNKVEAGRVTEAYPAVIKDVGSENMWGIEEVSSSSPRTNTYPKAKVPDLTAGDRGLFVVAEVTQPDVIAEVDKGKLSAFSWKGLVEARVDNASKQIVLRNIDLFEISLVTMPINPDSTFVVGKSVCEDIYTVVLEKSCFDRPGAVTFLEAHGLQHEDIIEGSSSFLAYQRMGVPPSRLVSVRLSPGVRAAVGESAKAVDLPIQAGSGLSESQLGDNPMSDVKTGAEATPATSPAEPVVEVVTPVAPAPASVTMAEVEASLATLRESFTTELAGIKEFLVTLVTPGTPAPTPEPAPAPVAQAPEAVAPVDAELVVTETPDATASVEEPELELVGKGCGTCADPNAVAPVQTTSDDVFSEIVKSLQMLATAIDLIENRQNAQAELILALKGAVVPGTSRSEAVKSISTPRDPNAIFDSLPAFSRS